MRLVNPEMTWPAQPFYPEGLLVVGMMHLALT